MVSGPRTAKPSREGESSHPWVPPVTLRKDLSAKIQTVRRRTSGVKAKDIRCRWERSFPGPLLESTAVWIIAMLTRPRMKSWWTTLNGVRMPGRTCVWRFSSACLPGCQGSPQSAITLSRSLKLFKDGPRSRCCSSGTMRRVSVYGVL
jgi:hypothetical protein